MFKETWKKSDNKSTIRSLLSGRFNTPADPEKKFCSSEIHGMEDAAARLEKAFDSSEKIVVVGDYDCDGVGSVSILRLIFNYRDFDNFEMIFPNRFDGYGLSDKIVDEIITKPMGVVILIDNGIACVDEVAKLKLYGWDVIILDHHLPREDGVLPAADFMIDPEAIEGQSKFKHFCGAGLAYKLAEILCRRNWLAINKCRAIAAISTIADSVSLIDEENHTYDNWMIVRHGIRNLLNSGEHTQGLYCLLRAVGCEAHIDAQDLGFKIAPVINAVGRLYGDGAKKAYELLVSDSAQMNVYSKMADELVAINNMRKTVQNQTMERISETLSAPEANILVVYEPNIEEGILGLIAGNLAEKYRVSCIALSLSKEDLVKGSARAYGDFNIKEFLDRKEISELIYKHGGHKAAAGLVLKAGLNSNGELISPEEIVERFRDTCMEQAGAYKYEEPVRFYDFEIKPNDIIPDIGANAPGVIQNMEPYEPFGMGNPQPVFMLKDVMLDTRIYKGETSTHTLMGKTGQSIKLYLPRGIDAVNFSGEGKQKYYDAGQPDKVSLIGRVSKNYYYGKTSFQFVFDDIA